MFTVKFVFLLLALISFIAAAASFPSRVNLIGLGLAFWVLTLVIAGGS